MTLLDTKLEGVEGSGTVEGQNIQKKEPSKRMRWSLPWYPCNTAFLADTGIELAPNRTVFGR